MALVLDELLRFRASSYISACLNQWMATISSATEMTKKNGHNPFLYELSYSRVVLYVIIRAESTWPWHRR